VLPARQRQRPDLPQYLAKQAPVQMFLAARKPVSMMVADVGNQLAGFVCVFAEEDAVFGSSVRPSDA